MKVQRNIIIGKSGGNSGKNACNYKVSIPADMIRALGVTNLDKSVTLELVDEQIVIKKEKKPMTTTKYEVKKFSKEFKYEERFDIKTGCCIDDTDPESIGVFDSKEDAMLEASKHEPTCQYFGKFFRVEEVGIEIYEVDEDGDFFSGSDYDFPISYEFDDDKNDIVF